MKLMQQGSVMIVTLWTITLLMILIAALASQTRLSAQVAWLHQQDLQDWANITAAVNQAEMELMMERMPEPIMVVENPEELNVTPAYRFDGEELTLQYPQAENIKVRIYDHAGKINLRELNLPRLRSLLEKRMGEEADEEIEAMLAAWTDWEDLNDQAAPNGAERDYYENLDPPYQPRNGPLETVEEILLIRGFADVFKDVDVDAAFTIFGENELVNLNVATVEAMRLLPGLDEEVIQEILTWRSENEFRGNGDVARIVPAEGMAELRAWLNSRKSTNHFTIMVYKHTETAATDPAAVAGITATAWAETVELRGINERPAVLKVSPYQTLPLRFGVSTLE
jgi:general secretion pathway protein K